MPVPHPQQGVAKSRAILVRKPKETSIPAREPDHEPVQNRFFLRHPAGTMGLVRQRDKYIAAGQPVLSITHTVDLPSPRKIADLQAAMVNMRAQRLRSPRIIEPAQHLNVVNAIPVQGYQYPALVE